MRCARCRHEIPAAGAFCPHCGAAAERVCGRCSAANAAESRYCRECGAALGATEPPEPEGAAPQSYTPRHLIDKILRSRSALEGERKQVTVLFADLVSFTELSERLDPEAVHLIMDGCFKLFAEQVHRYEGVVNQFTGDGIMALFGAPVTHEDHAVRALHAAVGIRDETRHYAEEVQRTWGVPLAVRVGVNTGTVVVGRIGDNLRMDYTAQGDTTNLAARLQQTAAAGAICVGDTTWRIAGAAFEWHPERLVEVKGKSRPVAVHELIAPRPVRSRFEVSTQRGLTWFVGRDAELEQLTSTWERVQQQGAGWVVSVVGEAGIGKSRLLHEFKQRLAKNHAAYVEGSCFAYGDVISYLPFLGIVKTLLGLDGTEPEGAAERQIAQRLEELGVEPSIHAPYLQNLLSLPVHDELFPKLTPELVRERTVEALKTLVFAAARQRPMALMLEDLHWIDKATKDVVAAIVDGLPSVPLLVVLAYRPEYLHAWSGKAYHGQISLVRLPSASSAHMIRSILAKPYAGEIPLRRLSPEDSRLMIDGLLARARPADALVELIAGKTDGNPFFVEELTQALLDGGDLIRVDDRYVLRTAADTLQLPMTVQGVLLARIDRLDDDLKHVLQVASAIGRVFSYDVLTRAVDTGLDLDDLLLRLDELDFIYPIAQGAQREYSFKHVLTQQAVYDSLLAARRAELHERIGAALEQLYAERLDEYYELLAYHYSRSPNAERTLVYLDLANQKATRAFAIVEAKRYFDQAMSLLDTLPATADNGRIRLQLLVNQGTVMFLLVQFAEYEALLTRFAPLVDGLADTRLLGAYRARLGYCQCSLGALDEAVATLRDAGALCESVGNADDAAFAYTILQWTHIYRGDYADVVALREPIRRLMDVAFNLRWHVYASTAVAFAYAWLGRWGEAIEQGEAALRIAEEFADSSLTSFAARTLAIVHLFKGDRVRAAEHADLANTQAHALADKVLAQGTLAWVQCRSGDCRRGIEILERGTAMLRTTGFRPVAIWSTFSLAEGYLLAGDLAEAETAALECLGSAEQTGMKYFTGAACRLLAEIALARGETSVAAAYAERAVATLARIGAEPDLALAYATRGRVARSQGARSAARADLERSLALFERLDVLGEPDTIRRELDALGAP